ncbi:MAG: sigma-70 family RNA polymerase sigma factor [Anaerolineae bacterium]|nr:MAG: sigma-70 family RNA polymerase sigma factor [Anaerolineae bacterium]
MTKRTTEAWLLALRGPEQAHALEELRPILLRGLRAGLSGRVTLEKQEILEDFVQEALLKILAHLDEFRGESHFLTWAHKIAIRVAYSELRRLRWKDVSLQDLLPQDDSSDYTPVVLSDSNPGPEKQVIQRQMMALVGRLLRENLTERQRKAMMAVMVHGMPLEEVARRMGTNRNALYKLLHDARKRLRRVLHEEGLTPQEIMAIFEN